MTKYKQRAEVKRIAVLTLFFLTLLLFCSIAIATPTGPSNINVTANESKVTTAGRMVNISGGIISKMNVTASVQNPHWKAFVGWIDGKFTLDDSLGSTIYDWTLSSVGGEIYATRASGVASWGTISCANASEITTEDVALNQTGEDNITSTFVPANNSATFVVAGTTISASTCFSTNTYVNNLTQTTTFEEVILHDESNIIFATILEEDSTGYDGGAYDFQMLIPENGADTWVSSTAYYLYVELS
jgi:hypothetical protein